MSAVVAEHGVRSGAGEVRLRGVGVRFDFDGQGRVLTPVLSHLRRRRGSAWGLSDVDLHLEPGSALALVGATGSGKTTLLRVLARVLPPDAGEAEIEGRVGSLLAADAGLQLLLTGRENSELLGVLAGQSVREARAGLEAVAERSRLGDAFDRPVHTYSAGMRARLGLAVIQSISPRVLLLDEVFEALDHEFRGIVERFARGLRERGGIVVAAGHDHDALSRICPQAAWLEGGRVRMQGPFAEVIAAYRAA
ncbi:MAG TPA: ATP-binding cassette domain-containing protein [Solirubrobacterales bacterium]|nr:ATP-binding cassette domain-containing protein [Solirubrobacterales bacterium]